ncbi:hypothetical protein BKD30_01110 [Tersicoccus phoenicis]|uniref:DNA-binding protein n=1 Tax=Tersicoccus phoenicis TaxID=554083 RepID=A0A1R1LP42_9MICC|nr:hypothetical protein [Tersicoccus phoenicis]OMH29317.1 hypothetical protein BKD30_01110 [Tersicoccus phoenicis]
MSLTVRQVLTEAHSSLTEQDVALVLQATLPSRVKAQPPSQSEVDLLKALSGLDGAAHDELVRVLDDPDATQRYSDRIAANLAAQTLHSTLSPQATAHLLGVDRTTVDRRRKAHQLYAITTPIGLRYPAWQFHLATVMDEQEAGTDEAGAISTVPSAAWLQEVIEAIPADVHPLTVGALMTEPAEETDGRSPLSWLASGGPAGPVVALVRELAWLP